ncbi:MAG: 50S ribosomal protein L6 [Bacteroidetes bacterium]|nr:50S ribosomal protein L6 [Bacteroidota bacterium]MCY4204952.1 50S ribosomal protein L6 [Bacteroidota bacterium]
MSRIGKKPITVSEGVQVEISKGNAVTVTGPKGTLQLQVSPELTLSQDAPGILEVSRPTDQKRHRAMHGLYRSLLANMVVGVSQGFQKQLEIIGVGTRAEVNNGVLELALGFSHPVYFVPPDGVNIEAEGGGRGRTPRVIISGIDKQVVGQVAAKIRSLRPPEPYKGKGIRYVNEYVRRKAGKTASK